MRRPRRRQRRTRTQRPLPLRRRLPLQRRRQASSPHRSDGSFSRSASGRCPATPRRGASRRLPQDVHGSRGRRAAERRRPSESRERRAKRRRRGVLWTRGAAEWRWRARVSWTVAAACTGLVDAKPLSGGVYGSSGRRAAKQRRPSESRERRAERVCEGCRRGPWSCRNRMNDEHQPVRATHVSSRVAATWASSLTSVRSTSPRIRMWATSSCGSSTIRAT